MEMFNGWDKIFLTLVMTECVIGLLGNVFIMLVNSSKWVQNRKICLADCILTCLAISRIGHLLLSLIDSCIIEFSPDLYDIYTLAKSMDMLWAMTNHLATWLSTCFSIFCFLKIAHFSHPLFLWMKWRMDKVILALVMLSLFLLVFDILWLDKVFDNLLTVNITDKGNLSLYLEERRSLSLKTLLLSSLTYLIPLVLSLTSLLLLFLFLLRHTRNLHLSSLGSGEARTEVHKRAMKMVLSFLVLFTVHSFSSLLTYWLFFTSWKKKVSMCATFVLYIFSSGHTFILIFGNTTLRQSALRTLCLPKIHLVEKSKSFSFYS